MSNAAHPMGFWIGAKGGLIDAKHFERMGSAVWMFLYLLLRQTTLNPAGEGVVNYGHPLTLDTICSNTRGIPVRTIQRWIATLRRTGYIRTEIHSKHGITFWIAKGKHKTKLKRVSVLGADKVTDKLTRLSTPEVALNQKHSRPDVAENPDVSTPEVAAIAARDSVQPIGFQGSTAISATPITKDFISKDLSLLQQGTPAQTAGSLTALLGKTARLKTMPIQRQPTGRELDEQRRRMLDLEETYYRKHPEMRPKL